MRKKSAFFCYFFLIKKQKLGKREEEEECRPLLSFSLGLLFRGRVQGDASLLLLSDATLLAEQRE